MAHYYTPAEVAVHNTHTDIWVSFLGSVFDLTRLVAENEGVLTQPIVKEAGNDISHWFDARVRPRHPVSCMCTRFIYSPKVLLPPLRKVRAC